MAFDATTIERIIQHLKSGWTVQTCPMCKKSNWEVHGPVTLSLGGGSEYSAAPGQNLPCAAIVCQSCGNTLIVNLVVAGIVRAR
jgi:hypothetical protein